MMAVHSTSAAMLGAWLALSLSIAPASGAWAQTVPPPARQSAPPATQASPEALRQLQTYASCLAWKRPAKVRAVLAMDFTSETYRRELMELGSSSPTGRNRNNCAAAGRLRMGGLMLAGALAEAVIRTDYPRPPSAVLPADWSGNPVTARAPSEAVALCLVQKRSDAVRVVLASEPGSPSEVQALQQIAPDLPACIGKGQEVRFTKPTLRATLATALYRALHHFAPRG